MFERWKYQKLEDEKLHYITEWSYNDGICGEHFFEYHQYGDMIKFCIDNNISFKEIELPTFEEAESEYYLLGKHKLTDIDFSCRIKMFEEDKEGTLFKTQYKMTLEMIETLPAEALGQILKELNQSLKQYIYELNKKK
jgi:hypothetical protein